MDWLLTGINREAGGISSRFIRQSMMTKAPKVMQGAVLFAESGLSAVKAVFPHSANNTANHKTKKRMEHYVKQS